MTRIEDTIHGLWRTLRARNAAGVRARRRVVVTTGVAAFVLLFLVAIGFGALVLIALAAAAAAASLLATVFVARRYGAAGRNRASTVTRKTQAVVVRVASGGSAGLRRMITRGVVHVVRMSRHSGSWARTRGRALRPAIAAAHGLARRVATQPRRPARSQPNELRTAAINANAFGTQLRRAGNHVRAVEQHRRALTIFRALGDRHGEALTLNNLGLALEHTGDPVALDLLEEAATILGELGDEQHEGQVIANLALAFRRRGSEDECSEALDTALRKLDPRTNAYRKVDGLRRAS